MRVRVRSRRSARAERSPAFQLAGVGLEDGLVDGVLLVDGVVLIVPAGEFGGAFVFLGVLVGLGAGGDLSEGPAGALTRVGDRVGRGHAHDVLVGLARFGRRNLPDIGRYGLGAG